jgi:molybdopterin-guanine dinucleotide biosynthesis protein A
MIGTMSLENPPDQLAIDALLPAGGRVSGEFAQRAGAEIKALIRFNGASILERTIFALKGVEGIGRIVVVGPEAVRTHGLEAGATAALNESDSGSANVLLGLEWLQAQKDRIGRVLVVTTDMPFLTSEGISAFLRVCPHDKDICVPVVERIPFERVYPGLVRTDTRLADGWFRLGGLYLLDPATLLRNRVYLDEVHAARKSNLKMARMAGMSTILRYITRQLTTHDIVSKACEILHCTGAVVTDTSPEIGFDIDLLEEYVYALNRFNAGGKGNKES